MTKEQRFKSRNDHVRKLYDSIKKKNPKWRNDAVVEEVAKLSFLAIRTVEAIIYREGIYNESTNKGIANPNQTSLFN